MRKIGLFILTALAAVAFTGCETAPTPPANAAVATPARPAAPTKEALLELDKKANEAWIKGDKAHFEGMLSDKFVSYDYGERMDRAGVLAMIGTSKCDIKTWSLEDPQMSTIDADTYVISYKANFDGSCTGPDGKSMKVPSPIRAASIWVRSGDTWKGAYHGETPIIDPKAPPAAPAKAEAKRPEPKKPAADADSAAADTAAADLAQDDAETAKEKAASSQDEKKAASTAKKEEPKKAGGTGSMPGGAKVTPSANTDALAALHASGWEAFKNKDAKWFDANLTNTIAFVDPTGWHSGKAEVIKLWTETMKCTGITKTSFTGAVATALSPTVEILTGIGTADGTCDGQKNGPLYNTAVYVKEGAAWKLAFLFEAPPMKKM